MLDESKPFQKFLTDAACGIGSTCLTAQEATPAQLVLPVDHNVDWNEITKRKQKKKNESCERENKKRLEHTCEQGDKVLLKVPGKTLRRAERIRRGPHEVIKHNDDGSVTIQKSPCVTDTANIRRLDPFFQ